MGTKVILVVSQEERHCTLLQRCLSQAGYLVFIAADAADLTNILTIVYPDLIVADVYFSDPSLPSLPQWLAEDRTTRTIPCIGMTMYTQWWDDRMAKVLGYDGLITLPFDARHMLAYLEPFLTTLE